MHLAVYKLRGGAPARCDCSPATLASFTFWDAWRLVILLWPPNRPAAGYTSSKSAYHRWPSTSPVTRWSASSFAVNSTLVSTGSSYIWAFWFFSRFHPLTNLFHAPRGWQNNLRLPGDLPPKSYSRCSTPAPAGRHGPVVVQGANAVNFFPLPASWRPSLQNESVQSAPCPSRPLLGFSL